MGVGGIGDGVLVGVGVGGIGVGVLVAVGVGVGGIGVFVGVKVGVGVGGNGVGVTVGVGVGGIGVGVLVGVGVGPTSTEKFKSYSWISFELSPKTRMNLLPAAPSGKLVSDSARPTPLELTVANTVVPSESIISKPKL